MKGYPIPTIVCVYELAGLYVVGEVVGGGGEEREAMVPAFLLYATTKYISVKYFPMTLVTRTSHEPLSSESPVLFNSLETSSDVLPHMITIGTSLLHASRRCILFVLSWTFQPSQS